MKTRLLALLLVTILAGCEARTASRAAADSVSVSGQFSGPESIQYYAPWDEYFVSNVNGDMTEKDDNGFISRVGPDGTIKQLKWIDGATLPITLHAPKGMVIHGDTLFVADIDSIRAFSIPTGSPVKALAVAGARFLNDLAISSEGVIYVSDSGLKAGLLPTGTDAVYRLDSNGPAVVEKGTWLGRPNGLAIGPEGLTVLAFGSKVVMRFTRPGGPPDTIATLMQGSLDGVVRLSRDTLLVSSWDGKAVYEVDLKRQRAHPLFTNLEAPADIGYDPSRHRLLIPLVTRNRLEFRRLP